ncbi:MAG: porin [Candidatus Pseudobacter hemicellulosilyticus]|uniref:Porin n=1 Tax=Candidatus Pseudobacter hemicellulosilyticus TaxID=3121375 RepID=A0AAJ5WVU4_9BACT|nr:MAG: porin [Pseudobacter sp.]
MKKLMMAGALAAGICSSVLAQEEAKTTFTLSGYAELYYTYDANRPLNNTRPGFVYSHHRANEVNLNLAFLKGNYSAERLRANLAIGAGTYMNANLAAEPGVLKNIYEANAGVKLSKTHNLWLDAGILPSHIGFESAIGKDNWTLTRSLVADNSPYYEAGAKLGYTSKNEKWYLAVLYLNGWQRIQRVDGNTTPAAGIQLSFKPAAAVTLNYSGFAGNDKPDSARLMRYYHNLYGIFQLSPQFGIMAGFDYGLEQQEKGSSKLNNWFTPVLILQYKPDATNSLAVRGEYFQDKNGVIISSGTPAGFKTIGWSINYDRQLFNKAVWRIELRSLHGKEDYFSKRDQSATKNNLFVSTALAIAF